MITSKVSAALFRSRIPSSAFLNRSTNLFVKRPENMVEINMIASTALQDNENRYDEIILNVNI
jgi:hypothetical protein